MFNIILNSCKGTFPLHILPPSTVRVLAHTSLLRWDICQRGYLNPGTLIPHVATSSTTIKRAIQSLASELYNPTRNPPLALITAEDRLQFNPFALHSDIGYLETTLGKLLRGSGPIQGLKGIGPSPRKLTSEV